MVVFVAMLLFTLCGGVAVAGGVEVFGYRLVVVPEVKIGARRTSYLLYSTYMYTCTQHVLFYSRSYTPAIGYRRGRDGIFISISLHCVSHTPTQDSQTATDEGDELQELVKE